MKKPSWFTLLWRRLTFDERRRRVRRTVQHPVFGEMQFFGRRNRDDSVGGYWKLTPPGFTRHLTVAFEAPGDTLPPADLAHLEKILSDLDGLYERIRPAIAEEYDHWVGGPLPDDWREAFRLEDIGLPDLEMGDETWQVTYWCEGAQHWFRMEMQGETVTYVSVEG